MAGRSVKQDHWFRSHLQKATCKWSGLGCSKPTTSLVNVSLKFQSLKYLKYSNIFCWKKCEKLLQLRCKSFSHFFNKNINVFGYKDVKHLISWPLNKPVKLTVLWTTESRGVQRSRKSYMNERVIFFFWYFGWFSPSAMKLLGGFN